MEFRQIWSHWWSKQNHCSKNQPLNAKMRSYIFREASEQVHWDPQTLWHSLQTDSSPSSTTATMWRFLDVSWRFCDASWRFWRSSSLNFSSNLVGANFGRFSSESKSGAKFEFLAPKFEFFGAKFSAFCFGRFAFNFDPSIIFHCFANSLFSFSDVTCKIDCNCNKMLSGSVCLLKICGPGFESPAQHLRL